MVNNLLAAIPFFKRHEIDEIDRPPLPTCIYTTAIVDSEHVLRSCAWGLSKICSSIKAVSRLFERIRFRLYTAKREIRNVLSKIGVYWREAWASLARRQPEWINGCRCYRAIGSELFFRPMPRREAGLSPCVAFQLFYAATPVEASYVLSTACVAPECEELVDQFTDQAAFEDEYMCAHMIMDSCLRSILIT